MCSLYRYPSCMIHSSEISLNWPENQSSFVAVMNSVTLTMVSGNHLYSHSAVWAYNDKIFVPLSLYLLLNWETFCLYTDTHLISFRCPTPCPCLDVLLLSLPHSCPVLVPVPARSRQLPSRLGLLCFCCLLLATPLYGHHDILCPILPQ